MKEKMIKVEILFTGERIFVTKPSKIKYYKKLAEKAPNNYAIIQKYLKCDNCNGKGFVVE